MARIEALRRHRFTGRQIAQEVGVSPASVSWVFRRLGLNRIAGLEPAEPVRRYERAHPGELIHLDIKKLGRFDRVGHCITGDRTGHSNSRGIGWEFVHVCIDDASRIAFSQVMPDETQTSAVAFLQAARLLDLRSRNTLRVDGGARSYPDRNRQALSIRHIEST